MQRSEHHRPSATEHSLRKRSALLSCHPAPIGAVPVSPIGLGRISQPGVDLSRRRAVLHPKCPEHHNALGVKSAGRFLLWPVTREAACAHAVKGDAPSTIDLTHDAEYGAPFLLV
jgi:hypothetical protein